MKYQYHIERLQRGGFAVVEDQKPPVWRGGIMSPYQSVEEARDAARRLAEWLDMAPVELAMQDELALG